MTERLMIGGLFRCCVQTFNEERADPEEPAKEGQVLECKWCSDSMVYRDGAWRWNRDEPT